MPQHSESFSTRILRWKFNFFPAFRRTGGKIQCISADFKYVRVAIPLNWRTRNYVGTIFGGSMYGAVDPVYMVMFIKILGPGYVVWDKAARIRFRKPARSVLTAEFRISDAEISAIRQELRASAKLERSYEVELVDAQGETCATVTKVLHFANRED